MIFLRLLRLSLTLLLINEVRALCPAVAQCVMSENCDLLPVPRKSIAAPVGPAGYELILLRPGVYSWTDGTYYTLIVYHNRRLFVVDFPGFRTAFKGEKYLLNSGVMELLGSETPTHLDMVYSHRHLDHIGGAPIFWKFMKSKFPGLQTAVWGTSETRNFLAESTISNIPMINFMVRKKGTTIKLGRSLRIKLIILGGHTNTDIAVHVLPNRDGPGIMYFADFVIPGFVLFVDFGLSTNINGYIKAQEALLKFDFDTFVSGHWNLGKKQDVFQNLRYTRDVIKFRREAAAEVTPEQLAAAGLGRIGDPAALEFGNLPLAAKLTIDVANKICVRKLITKYGCDLGAADVFAPSHCKTAFFYGVFNVEQPQVNPTGRFAIKN